VDLSAVVIVVVVLVGVWAVSFVVEALRPTPETPESLSWDPVVKPRYLDVDGVRLRYIQVGTGPPLVLLHTLRTQLDLFHKVIPDLAKEFTVYAPDYPGHGYSDIPDAPYDADFIAGCIARFLEEIDVDAVTLSGVSIGASIALILGGQRNPRIKRIVAINPYDYARGKGLARSSLLGRVLSLLTDIPLVGDTVMRLRNYLVIRTVMNGGVHDPRSIDPGLMKEMYRVGNRRGHYRAFTNLLRNSPSWEQATGDYPNISVPVLLVWGEHDWASPEERQHDAALIPNVESVTVANGGHFLPLDAPAEVIRLIRSFADSRPA